jgi:hypothetical protein
MDEVQSFQSLSGQLVNEWPCDPWTLNTERRTFLASCGDVSVSADKTCLPLPESTVLIQGMLMADLWNIFGRNRLLTSSNVQSVSL